MPLPPPPPVALFTSQNEDRGDFEAKAKGGIFLRFFVLRGGGLLSVFYFDDSYLLYSVQYITDLYMLFLAIFSSDVSDPHRL